MSASAGLSGIPKDNNQSDGYYLPVAVNLTINTYTLIQLAIIEIGKRNQVKKRSNKKFIYN